MLDPKCIYRKSIFAKCTRLACLLSFVSLFFLSLLPLSALCSTIRTGTQDGSIAPLSLWDGGQISNYNRIIHIYVQTDPQSLVS